MSIVKFLIKWVGGKKSLLYILILLVSISYAVNNPVLRRH